MTRYWLLLLILSIAGFLRCYRLTTVPPGLYRDEAMDGSDALTALETGRFQVFYPEDGGREGLYVNVAAAFVRVAGNRAWVLRLPAAVFGVLTVWGVYLFAVEFASVEVALLGAFFLATSFWHIVFSRIAFRAIAAPCLLTWALCLLLVSLRRFREGRAWWVAVVAAGVVYGLGFYTYLAYRATPLLLAVVLAIGARKAARVSWAFGAAAVVTAMPLVFYFAVHPGAFLGRTAQVSALHMSHPSLEVIRNVWRTGRMFFTRGDVNWRHNIAWRAELFWPVATLLVVGIFCGRRADGGLALRRVALWWLVIAAVPVVLSGEAVPHALRAILMVPAVSILAAEGAWRVYVWLAARTARVWAPRLGVLLLVMLAIEPYYTYFHRWATDPHVPAAFDAEAVAVAEEINRLPDEYPKYVIASDTVALQPIVFLTGTPTARDQQVRNIHYLTGDSCATSAIPVGATVFCLPPLQ